MIIAALAVAVSGQANAQGRYIKMTCEQSQDTLYITEFLKQNPADTLHYEGTVALQNDEVIDGYPVKAGEVVEAVVVAFNKADGPHLFTNFVKVVKSDPYAKLAAKCDSVVVETRYASGLTRSPKLRYDIYYGQLPQQLYRTTDGKPVLRQGRKDGLNFFVGPNYQFGKAANGFGLEGGFAYFGKWWKAEVLEELARKEMGKNAEDAGRMYYVCATEAVLGGQPFKFGRYDQFRLMPVAGVRFEHYSTNSKVDETGNVKSWGNSLAPVVGLDFTGRIFASRHQLGIGFRAFMEPKIEKNATQASQHRDWGFKVTARYYINAEKGFWKAKKPTRKAMKQLQSLDFTHMVPVQTK